MSYISVFAFLLIFSPLKDSAIDAVNQEVSSSVESATVYLSGAQVTRTGNLQLKSGLNTVVFNNLSSQFSAQSIQLSTNQSITILSIRKNVNSQIPSSAELDSLNQRKKEIESLLKLKQAEESVLQRELDILMANKNLKGDNQKISALEIKQAMEFFREKLNEIERSRLEIAVALEEARQDLNTVNSQINDITREIRLRSGQIIAEIQSPRSQSVDFNISYFLSSAGWYPSYDIRVDDIDNPLSLTYKANIYQNSGINWDDVQLTISSAEPLASTRLPSVQPLYLGFEVIRPQQTFQDQRESSALKSLDEAVVNGMAQKMEAPAVPSVSVNQNQTSFSFTIDTPYSVTGDGQPKTVSVQEHSLPATYQYFAAPKVSSTAFLTASITDWEELNLLNGEMNLYFEQTFVGQSQLRSSVAGDTLQFSLGKDEDIIIERKRLREFTEKNFFGNRITETHAWDLIARNTKSKSIELSLVDQVPISTNEDIKISLEERSGAEYDRTTGMLRWNLKLEPGNAKNNRFLYKVEYPSGKQLQSQN